MNTLITVWKPGALVILSQDWASYERGDKFVVAKAVDCGEIQQADGSFTNPINLRVVLQGEDIRNEQAHRTIPAEYARVIPHVGQFLRVQANQALRNSEVLAVDGCQALLSYDMPGGKVFGRVIDVAKPGWYRAVCLKNLPKRWTKIINEMDGDSANS